MMALAALALVMVSTSTVQGSVYCQEGFELDFKTEMFDSSTHGDVCRKMGDTTGNKFVCPVAYGCRRVRGPPYCAAAADNGPCRVPREQSARPEDPPQMEAKLLFKKPEDSTGQLELMEEGLEVFRKQKEPFAVVSVVGPTRTGKSSLLGRSFLQGGNENVFEIGSGVHSFTKGVYMTSEPIVAQTESGPLNVFLVDTEGFNGVGQQTSMTYEANLFGLTFLFSNVMIFNSIFPVDAGTVRMIEGHCRHAMLVLQELEDAHIIYNKNSRPAFVWAVQNFNLFNLKNSDMTETELLSMLEDTSDATFAEKKQAQAIFGGRGGPNLNLLNTLFTRISLVPVRRPHEKDEVVANLADYPMEELSKDYVQDVKRVRTTAFEGLRAIYDGPAFAQQIEDWAVHGHIVLDTQEGSFNETAALEKFHERMGSWFKTNCEGIKRDFRKRLEKVRGTEDIESPKGTEAMDKLWKDHMQNALNLKKAMMSRTVQTSYFWQSPGLIATHAEEASKTWVHSCISTLFAVKRKVMNRTLAVQVLGQDRSGFESSLQKTLRLRREKSMKLEPGDSLTSKQISESHEECFLVYDEYDTPDKK